MKATEINYIILRQTEVENRLKSVERFKNPNIPIIKCNDL